MDVEQIATPHRLQSRCAPKGVLTDPEAPASIADLAYPAVLDAGFVPQIRSFALIRSSPATASPSVSTSRTSNRWAGTAKWQRGIPARLIRSKKA